MPDVEVPVHRSKATRPHMKSGCASVTVVLMAPASGWTAATQPSDPASPLTRSRRTAPTCVQLVETADKGDEGQPGHR
jgi:hypothetical protein